MFRQSLFFLVLSVILATTYAGYTCPKPCYGNMCCSIPSDNQYYLTDFCGSQSACGPIPSCSGGKYFTADAQRFGCSKYLNVCRNSNKKCIKAQVIDSGPAMWVEQNAGRAIIDGSPQLCKDLFGASSCGWSDKFSITATIASAKDTRPLGPFNVTDAEFAQMLVDHKVELESCMASNECAAQE
ncbi:lysozyme [Heterostelium album PN500]|uniref:Lysozyme n=1 Tax=Heterostelium pallidum (strain ATCC 26659 / Pp 5 / PN500) TaxID=670386 RepID=D3BUA4_HETP5|nr:lysozyme [Heterostelium album PN500]EFA75038.1 lysozyme [Heterostelium album PN500]|eukprot:XP_020427172.1 lysozyme [Heterostelium album PN500]